MGWQNLIPLIIQYGIPAAEKIWQMVTSGADPTQADWDALKKLVNQTPLSQMQDALARAGIPLDDPRAVAFLALVK